MRTDRQVGFEKSRSKQKELGHRKRVSWQCQRAEPDSEHGHKVRLHRKLQTLSGDLSGTKNNADPMPTIKS